MTFHTS